MGERSFGYQLEKFRTAQRLLQPPHPNFEGALDECRHTLNNLRLDDLDIPAREHVATIIKLTERHPELRHLTLTQRYDLCRAVDALVDWFRMHSPGD